MSSPPPHTEVELVGSRPDCDFCMRDGVKSPASVDGKTTSGPWANMCEAHFETEGVGLGLGRGQRLVEAKP